MNFKSVVLLVELFVFVLNTDANVCLDNDKNTPVHIDKNKLYKEQHIILQDVAEVEYVALETISESLIDDQKYHVGICVTYSDIFVGQKDEILHFNRKGKYLNKIKNNGQGPGEYVLLGSFTVDELKKEVIVCDLGLNKLLFYTYDGVFVREVMMDGCVHQIELINNNLLFCYSEHYKHEPSFVLRSLVNGKKEKILSPIYSDKSGIHYGFTGCVYSSPRKYKNEVFVNTAVSDTIFSVNESERIPRYILIPPNKDRTTRDCEGCATPFLLCETEKFANIHVFGKNGKKVNSYIVDKKNGAIYAGYLLDSEFGNAIFPFNTRVDNQLVALLDVYRLKKGLENGRVNGRLKNITLSLEEEDNPVLVIGTIK